MHFLVTHSTVLVTRKFCGAVSFRLYDYNKQRWYNWTVSQGLPKIVQHCQKLPKIVIRKFCGAVSFHLCDTIGLLSKNCPNLHQIAPNYPKLSKLFKNVHFLVTHSIVFVAIKLQCSKLSFL